MSDTPDAPGKKYVVLAGGPRDDWVLCLPDNKAEVTVLGMTGYWPAREPWVAALGGRDPVFDYALYRERSEGSLIFDYVPAPRGKRNRA